MTSSNPTLAEVELALLLIDGVLTVGYHRGVYVASVMLQGKVHYHRHESKSLGDSIVKVVRAAQDQAYAEAWEESK